MKKNDLAKIAILAMHARDNAYAPYSNHPVGAVLVSESGRVYIGANVETANYKGFCAEGSAIAAMATAGERKIRDIAVIGPAGSEMLLTPCGDCRQRINEFADKKTRIHSLKANGALAKTYTIDQLLPHAFGPDNVAAAQKTKRKKKK